MEYYAVALFYWLLFSMWSTFHALNDINNPARTLKDGETLVSSNQMFELGLFSPGNSQFRYLGLWYKFHPASVVWVANRETPLFNTLGSLYLTAQGHLVLSNSTKHIVWSSNQSRIAMKPLVQLLDTGNLVIIDREDRDEKKFLWQTFDHPSATLLPGMKLGGSFNRMLSSWKNEQDPAPGNYSVQFDPRGYPQVLLMKENRTQFRLGSWNGMGFTGVPQVNNGSFIQYELNMSNEHDFYFKYMVQNTSVASMYTLSPSGLLELFIWSERTNDWMIFSSSPNDQCDNYAVCGAFASCNKYDSPPCSCLQGFIPESPREWESQEWLDGCKPKILLNCSDKVDFLNISGCELPDTRNSSYYQGINLDECRSLCLRNCSCTAYASSNISGTGCLHWFGNLIDIKKSPEHKERLYVRIAASELERIESKGYGGPSSGKPPPLKKGQIRREMEAGIVLLLVSVIIIICILKRPQDKCGMTKESYRKIHNNEYKQDIKELPKYNFKTILLATNKFSNSNKLGQGGFGPVYKGKLEGQEIAVKRLSKCSRQGWKEFINEVSLIAKLQHRNLVKLLGYCIHEYEKMLIYEYMPNKSLDSFIFDQTRSNLLDWQKRKGIIGGIARGLLYLHQDSTWRIIHRDLKISNILLDRDMNPKISDFGFAKAFEGDQTEADASKVAGTYGYMSPEYAVNGRISMKSDVFSFGVMVLEIVSGKRNSEFCHPDHDLNLLSHAWMLWEKGTSEELIDECIKDSCDTTEALRCISVALLCVQQHPEQRPDMSSVVVMLSCENPLPQANHPGFFPVRTTPNINITSSHNNQLLSGDEIELALPEGGG